MKNPDIFVKYEFWNKMSILACNTVFSYQYKKGGYKNAKSNKV